MRLDGKNAFYWTLTGIILFVVALFGGSWAWERFVGGFLCSLAMGDWWTHMSEGVGYCSGPEWPFKVLTHPFVFWALVLSVPIGLIAERIWPNLNKGGTVEQNRAQQSGSLSGNGSPNRPSEMSVQHGKEPSSVRVTIGGSEAPGSVTTVSGIRKDSAGRQWGTTSQGRVVYKGSGIRHWSLYHPNTTPFLPPAEYIRAVETSDWS